MCIIILKQKGIQPPSKKTLKTCFANNPDGAGFMYWNNGKVSIEKGFMTYKHLKRALNGYRFTSDDVVIYHFRIATCGTVNSSQTHPFPVTDVVSQLQSISISSPLAMAHNGIISGMNPTEEISDTMMFVKNILADKKVKAKIYDEESAQSRLIEMASSASRLAFLDFKGRVRIFGDWDIEKETGLLFSNDDYKYARTYKYTDDNWKNIYGYGERYGSNTNNDEGFGACPSCQNEYSYDLFMRECYSCGFVNSTDYLNEHEKEKEEIDKENADVLERDIKNAEKTHVILTDAEKEIKKLLIQGAP